MFVDTASAQRYRGGYGGGYGRGYYGGNYGRGYYGPANRGYYGRSYYPRTYYGGYRSYAYPVVPVYPSYVQPYYQPGFSLNLAGPNGAFGLSINP